jgi:hypothetical protein
MRLLTQNISCALDPVHFARESLSFEPDPWQVEALRWAGRKMILNCSRQSGKSTIAAILAVHQALHKPGSLTLLVSPSLRQSSEIFRKVVEELEKIEDQPARIENNKMSLQLETKSRIVSLPSQENTVRGFSSVNLVIEDEAARVKDDLHFAIRPMLAVSGGKHLLLSTPWGRRGHFFNEWETGEEWKKIKITAEQCPRISEEFLKQERASLGSWYFEQEYFCEFKETVDSVFRTEDIEAAFDNSIRPLQIGGFANVC